MKICDFTKPELDKFREQCNFTEDDGTWANRYKEMAQDELKHAGYIHDRVVKDIEELQRVYTPPQEMMEKWDADHKKYIEKAAWIRQMLSM